MLSYKHFTLDERECLQKLLEKGETIRFIARSLGKSPSSVCREIKRNQSKKGYHHWRAQILTITRRRKHRMKLVPGTSDWDYIVEKLGLYWSPEEICGRWELEKEAKPNFSICLIYRYLNAGLFPGISRKTHLRRRGKLRRPRNGNYQTIHPDRIIPQWPAPIRNRERIGDWEGDTVYGGVGKGLLVSQVDRKSRFLRLGLLEKRDSTLTKDIIVSMLRGLPVHSVSLDNGSEFSEFKALEQELGAPIFFAEPHKPWQRGTNENTNDIIRFFFPKGFDFHSISHEDVDAVVSLINYRPRKCLGWKTPAEVFYDFFVALT
ncbi:MAG: IS30 family transposase [Bacteroidales bacterium]|nr:IS30 family transposase [Bacteroidales bacterium]